MARIRCLGFSIALGLAAFSWDACSRRVAPPVTSISDEPAPPAEGPHHAAFAPLADKIRPAVVVLAAFDEHGGLVAKQHGFFISANGDLLAERSAMNNAASAVVKSADGHAYDIFGAYVRSAAPSFILLKTNARNVPHLDAPARVDVAEGAPVAIVLSGNAPNTLLEGTVTKRKRDETGEWLKFEPAPPDTALGAPVIDENGAVIGIVAQREDTAAPAIYRSTGGNNPFLAQTAAPVKSPAPEKAAVAENTSAVAEATPTMESTLAPTPAEAPAARSVAPPATPGKVVAHAGRLVYAPAPRYPQTLAWIGWDRRGAGVYRLTFNSQGEARDVQVTHSTGNAIMDRAAVETLRSWRAQPGKEWSLTVPVDFKQ